MKRDAAFRLTRKDIEAVRSAVLDSRQGVVRDDGSL